MVVSDVVKIKSVYDQFPWDTREDYRVLRQVRPDFELPSDGEISKIWGSFSNFKKEMGNGSEDEPISETLSASGSTAQAIIDADTAEKAEEVRGQRQDVIMIDEDAGFPEYKSHALNDLEFGYIEFPEIPGEPKEITYMDVPILTEEQQIIRAVVGAFSDNLDFGRTAYRQKKKERPDLNLPSCHQIYKYFGTFAKFKQQIKPSSEAKISEEQRIINLARSIWSIGKIWNRTDYRNKRKSNPELGLPSSDRIEKLFGSFNKFKEYVLNNHLAECIGGEWDLSPEQLKEVRQKVQERRKEIFGEVRNPYEWEIRSRSRRRGGWVGQI